MNILVLNIGLNVGGKPNEGQKGRTIAEVSEVFENYDVKIKQAQGDWGKEETAVFKIELDENIHLEQLIPLVSYFCLMLEQDAIAFKVNKVGYMAFNPNYKGERFKFNDKYFLSYE